VPHAPGGPAHFTEKKSYKKVKARFIPGTEQSMSYVTWLFFLLGGLHCFFL
jgi:uncharacterized membrane protein